MDYQTLLLRHDRPPHFDWRKTRPRIERCIATIEAIFGTQFDPEWGAQDADYCCEMYLPLEADERVLIRFSAFGEMVSVSEEEPVPEDVLCRLQQAFAQHRFVYVPYAVLNTPYTGCLQFSTIDTWWDRFFDYY
jgi:hypothetical protein